MTISYPAMSGNVAFVTTTAHTVTNETLVLLDTSVGSITVTLSSERLNPANTLANNSVTVIDIAGAADTNPVQIRCTQGAETINGVFSTTIRDRRFAKRITFNGESAYFDDEKDKLAPAFLPTLPFGDFNIVFWTGIPTGYYYLTGLGSEFSNFSPQLALDPAVTYTCLVNFENEPTQFSMRLVFLQDVLIDPRNTGREMFKAGLDQTDFVNVPWRTYAYIEDLGGTILLVSETSVTQEPAGLDIPLQINFGPGGTSTDGEVTVGVNGDVTVNKSGYYDIFATLNIGRTGGAGVSELFVWFTVGPSQLGQTFGFLVANANAQFRDFFQGGLLFIPAGITLRAFIARGSGGSDSGGLMAVQPPVGLGLLPVPTARTTVVKYP